MAINTILLVVGLRTDIYIYAGKAIVKGNFSVGTEIHAYATNNRNTGVGTVKPIDATGYKRIYVLYDVVSTHQSYKPFSVNIYSEKNEKRATGYKVLQDVVTSGNDQLYIGDLTDVVDPIYIFLVCGGVISYKANIKKIYLI